MKIKSLIYFVLSLSFLGFANVSADQLIFETGSKARFHVSNTACAKEKSMLDSSWSFEVNAVMDITLTAPNEVEIEIQNLQINCVNNRPYYKHTLQYSSDVDPQEEVEEVISKLLHTPLHFSLDGNFEIHGSLDLVENAGNYLCGKLDADELELLCVTKAGFEQFLTNLFHLQGKEIKKGSKYPEAFLPDLSINYEINKISPNEIHATFDKINDKKGSKKRTWGEAKWDRTNGMIQQRDMNIQIKYEKKGSKLNHVYNLNWISEPLK